MTASISRSSFAQTRSCACLLDLFMGWHAYFPVTPVMFRPRWHVLISCPIDCLACLLSGHLCQDPKPKKHMERSTRAIPLYHLVILCLSQPRNVRRLPGPPVYTFFSGDGKPPWLGGPKAHSPHDMFIHAGFEAHGNRTSPHHPVGLLRSPRQRWLRCDY